VHSLKQQAHESQTETAEQAEAPATEFVMYFKNSKNPINSMNFYLHNAM